LGKKILLAVLTLLITLTFGAAAGAADLTLEAKAAVLLEPVSGRFLYELNPAEKLYPASMTKIMTLLLAAEAVEDGRVSLDDEVVASEYACGFGGSQVYLEPGEVFTLKEMLLAIAVGSANDASVAVAEFLAGSEEAFVTEMNDRARELGALNTNFVNPHGLDDPEHYTTARDMALIAREAVKHPLITELTSVQKYTFREEPELVLWNTNKLLWWYPGTEGLKTGTTSQAGRNLTSSVVRDNLRLIGVVMGVDKPRGHFSESMKLLNYGFARYEFHQIYAAGDFAGQAPVAKGAAEQVKAVAAAPVGWVVAKGEGQKVSYNLEFLPELTAPLAQGQKVGEAVVLADGEEVLRVDLLAAENVPKASLWQEFSRVLRSIAG